MGFGPCSRMPNWTQGRSLTALSLPAMQPQTGRLPSPMPAESRSGFSTLVCPHNGSLPSWRSTSVTGPGIWVPLSGQHAAAAPAATAAIPACHQTQATDTPGWYLCRGLVGGPHPSMDHTCNCGAQPHGSNLRWCLLGPRALPVVRMSSRTMCWRVGGEPDFGTSKSELTSGELICGQGVEACLLLPSLSCCAHVGSSA